MHKVSGVILVGGFAALALMGCNPPIAPSGSSGAFGVVTVGGKQKLYLPSGTTNANGNGFVTVVNVGVPGHGVSGAPAMATQIELPSSDVPGAYPTCTGGDASVIVAGSTGFPVVWLIDPATDTVIKSIKLPDTYGIANYSGGRGYVNGVAMDNDHHRAILAVYNGFALLDTTSGTITANIEAPPSENFGFDAVAQRIIAPFYQCDGAIDGQGNPLAFCGDYKNAAGDVITDGLNVVDLADNSVYTYQDPSPANANASASSPLGSEPDSAAVDSSNHVAVIPAERGGFTNVLDLSKASFNKGTKSFTAPNHTVGEYALEGSAAEPTKHFGFFEGEFSADVALVDLNAANGGSTTAWRVSFIPDTPDGNSWFNMGDPHGIAVTTGINDGHSVGFVVTGDLHWVARVDLEKFASAKVDSSGNVLSTDLAAAVTLLDATAHE